MENKMPDDLFKDSHQLQLFFNSDHIRLHNIHQYLKEKGIFAFANTTDSIANFACNFFIGIDSLNSLRRYADTKAYPKITGFILEPEINISLSDLRDYLNTHVTEKFPIKESTFINLNEDHNKLYVKIEYIVTNLYGYNIFKNEKKEACIEISKQGRLFLFNLIQNFGTDYSVVHGVIRSIIKNDSSIKFKLIEIDLSIFETTKRRHDFFLVLMKKFSEMYDVLGLIKYNRNKAFDSSAGDFFEKHHLKGSQETEIMTIEDLVSNLEIRGALIEGVEIVFYDLKAKHLFVLGLLSKEDKRKIEVGLAGDTKKIDYDSVGEIKSKTDISKFDSMGLNENEKQKIAMDIWNIISDEFYAYKKEMMKNVSSL